MKMETLELVNRVPKQNGLYWYYNAAKPRQGIALMEVFKGQDRKWHAHEKCEVMRRVVSPVTANDNEFWVRIPNPSFQGVVKKTNYE